MECAKMEELGQRREIPILYWQDLCQAQVLQSWSNMGNVRQQRLFLHGISGEYR
jgi:hypothetical protein